MSEETRKVLEMLSSGKVSVQEAEQLLKAVGAPARRRTRGRRSRGISAFSSTSLLAMAKRRKT